jgi:prephenate dehydrogenase
MKQRAAIVGGAGRMGCLFADMLAKSNCEVRVIEKGDALSKNAFAGAQLIMVAVPIEVAPAVIEAVGKVAPAEALLCDLTSLKVNPCRALAHSPQREVLGLHPMFGPSVRSFQGQKMVVCEVRSGSQTQAFLKQCEAWELQLVRCSAEHHDRVMALVQVLTHFARLLTGETLRLSGTPIAETLALASPIYQIELALVARLFSQDPNLYRAIGRENPEAPRIRKLFAAALTRISSAIEEDDQGAAMRAIFTEVQSYFGSFQKEAQNITEDLISYRANQCGHPRLAEQTDPLRG